MWRVVRSDGRRRATRAALHVRRTLIVRGPWVVGSADDGS